MLLLTLLINLPRVSVLVSQGRAELLIKTSHLAFLVQKVNVHYVNVNAGGGSHHSSEKDHYVILQLTIYWSTPLTLTIKITIKGIDYHYKSIHIALDCLMLVYCVSRYLLSI